MSTTESPPRKPGPKPAYKCAGCGVSPGRDKLMAKRVQFTTIGKPVRVIVSRTVGWFCEACIDKDETYNRAAYYESPGLADANPGQDTDGEG